MQGSKHAQPHYLRSSWLGRRDDQSEVTLARGLINGPILIFIAHVREEKERGSTDLLLLPSRNGPTEMKTD